MVGKVYSLFLPDKFGEVYEAEQKDTGINYCCEECAYARADSVQAGVGNQQSNRNDIGAQ